MQRAVRCAQEPLSVLRKETIRLPVHFHRDVAAPINVGPYLILKTNGKGAAGLPLVNYIERHSQTTVFKVGAATERMPVISQSLLRRDHHIPFF